MLQFGQLTIYYAQMNHEAHVTLSLSRIRKIKLTISG